MSTEKRSRGRPVGSGKNDAGHLSRIADELLADPKLKPTTAIKRVIYQRSDQSEQDVTLVRRLQGKWKHSAQEHLEAARKRRDDRAASRVSLADIAKAYGQLMDKLQEPATQSAILNAGRQVRLIAESIANSPAAKALAQFANSPLAKQLADYANSPGGQRMAEYARSPAAENIRKAIDQLERPAHLYLPSKR